MSNWNFSFALGFLPVYSTTPTYEQLSQSPVYMNTSTLGMRYYGSNTDCDYFYYSNGSDVVVMFPTYSTMYYTSLGSVVEQTSSRESSGQRRYYTASTYGGGLPYLVDTNIPYLGEFSSYTLALNYYQTNGVTYPNNDIVKYPYTFQNGYLFVFDLGQSGTMYSFDLISKSEEYSNVGDNPFPDTNQSYWFDNSLPETEETTIPSSSAITIQWQKGDKTNIFGQTQDMKASISGTSTGRYLYIYNPPAHYKWSGSNNPTASETVNYPVTIDGVSSGDNFYIYDSRAILYDFNQGGKVQGTVTGETGYGSVSTDGAISVVTSNGAIYTQNSGGSTDISGANGGSIAENINGLKETLDNFVNQFIQLLSAPISHIQQLIQSGNSFFEVFSGLFDWLPSEVSGIIISGLIIMIVIGVLKMLL